MSQHAKDLIAQIKELLAKLEAELHSSGGVHTQDSGQPPPPPHQ